MGTFFPHTTMSRKHDSSQNMIRPETTVSDRDIMAKIVVCEKDKETTKKRKKVLPKDAKTYVKI
jgi:hypothetical protein